MVIFVDVDVNEIARLGRDFFWRKPSSCPRCGAGFWWHGFVPAYFDHLAQAVFLRRLRCPCCGAVHRLRPKGYWNRFRSGQRVIRQVIINKFSNRGWLAGLPKPRQRLWWQRFRCKAEVMIGHGWEEFPDPFDLLISWGVIPVSMVI